MWTLEKVNTDSDTFGDRKKFQLLEQKHKTFQERLESFWIGWKIWNAKGRLQPKKRPKKEQVVAANIFGTEENLSPVQVLKMFEDMADELKLAQKLIDVVD